MASTAVVYNLVARDSASRTFNRVGDAAAGAEARTSRLGRAFASTGALIARHAAIIGAATVGIAAASIKMATDFQSSMTKIQTQAGGSARDVRVLRDEVLKLATHAQQSPKELADSLYHLKSVGMDNVSAMRALRQASDLAAVGGASLEDTTNALAGAWRSGIKGAGSFHQAVATVNAIIGAGNMRMEDFTAAIGTGILPAAKTFGLSLKQVGAALALMTDEGIPAQDAATRLRMSFSLLGAPSAAADKQLKKIGLSGLQLATAMRSPAGLIGAIQLLKDHLDKSGLSAAKQSQILSRAFGGGRSSSAILTLLNNLDVLKKKQDQVNNSTGKYDVAVAQQRKTAEAQFKRLESSLDVLAIRLGTVLLPPVVKFVGFLANTALPAVMHFGSALVDHLVPTGRLSGKVGQAKDFIDGLLGHAGTSTALRTQQGRKMTIDVGAQTKVTGAAKLGEKYHDVIVSAINSIKSGDVGKGIGVLLGSAFAWVTKNAGTLINGLVNALSGIDWVNVGKKVGGQALGFGVGFIDGVGDELFTVAFWKKHWLDVILAVIALIPVGKIVGVAKKLLSKLPWGKIFDFLGPLLKKIPWGEIFDTVSKAIPKWLGKIFDLGKQAGQLGAKLVRDAISLAGKIGSGIYRWLAEDAPAAAVRIYDWVTSIPSRLARAGASFASKGAQLVERLITAAVTKIPLLPVRLTTAVLKALGRFTLYKAGIALIQGLLNGIGQALAGVGKWLKRHIVDPIVNAVKSWFGIKSPSRVFHTIGADLVQGLINGISGAVGSAVKEARRLASRAQSVFSGARRWLVDNGRSFVNGLISGVNARFGAAASRASALGARIRGRFSGIGHWLLSGGRALVSGLISGIGSAMRGISGWLKAHVVNPIVSAVKHFFGIHSPSTVFHSIGLNMIKGLINGLASQDGTAIVKDIFGSMPAALGALVSKGMVSIANLPAKAMKALGGLGSKLAGLLGLGGGGGSGAGQWAGTARKALALLGMPTSLVGGVLRLIARESGGNPAAINLWDSNARAGHPSQGLMQTIPSTFAAYAGPFRGLGITNPLANIYAGLNYIKHRYPSLGPLLPGWSGGYAKGTNHARKGLALVGEAGAELINFSGGEQVLSHSRSVSLINHIVNSARSSLTREGKRDPWKKISASVVSGLSGSTAKIKSALDKMVKSIKESFTGSGRASLLSLARNTVRELTRLAKRRDALSSEISKATAVSNSAKSAATDFGQLTNLGDLSNAASVQTALASKVSGVKKFADDLTKLKKLGLSKALLTQLVDAGPDQGAQIAEAILNGATKTTIKKLNQTQSQLGSAASALGNVAAAAEYGSKISSGFIAGLTKQRNKLQNQMGKIAQHMGKVMARAFGANAHVSGRKVTHHATGGIIRAGELAMTGEQGPELLQAAVNTRVYTATDTRRIMRALATAPVRGGDGAAAVTIHEGDTVHVNVNHVPGYSTENDIQNAMAKVHRRQRLARA